MRGGKLLILIMVLVVVPSSYAIEINPQQYTIDEPQPGENYNIVLTLINPDVSTHHINAGVAEESSYLEPNLEIEKDSIELGPNERENLGITFTIPQDISPGKHELLINFLTAEQRIASFSLDFDIEGEKEREVSLENVAVDAKDTESPVYFTLEAENKGNVIEDLRPVVKISKEEERIKTMDESGAFRVMPGERTNLSLMFDPAQVEEGGSYEFSSYLEYNEQTTQELEGSFSLDMVETARDEKLKRIQQGEELKMSVDVERTAEEFSFYKINAEIPAKNISRTIEGSFEEEIKSVEFNLSTNELSVGEYKLSLEIAEGRELENVRKEEYELRVQEGFLMRMLPFFIVLAVVFLAAGVYYFGSPLFLREYFLKKKINKVNKNFDGIEKDMRKLNKELNEFISSSNNWLSRYGRGFK